MSQDLAATRGAGSYLKRIMEAHSVSGRRLAGALQIPQMRLSRILAGGDMTADTALRLGHYFGNGARFWLDIQTDLSIELAEQALKAEGIDLNELPQADASVRAPPRRRGPRVR